MAAAVASPIAAVASSISIPQALQDLASKLPQFSQLSGTKAASRLLLSICFVTLGYLTIAVCPAYLLPIGWLVLGTAFCGLYTLGYDAARGHFCSSQVLNSLIGHICVFPTLGNLESIKQQIQQRVAGISNSRVERTVRKMTASPFWFFSSIGQWIMSNYAFNFRKRILANVLIVQLLAAAVISLVIYKLGMWNLVKYWLAPLAVYFFWMSSFLKVDYSIEKSSVDFVVQYHFPAWVEVLSHDFSNYIACRGFIPSYHAKSALQALKKHLGENRMEEFNFGWSIFKDLPKMIEEAKNRQFDTLKAKASSAAGRSWEDINWTTALFITITPIVSLIGMILLPKYDGRTILTGFIFYYLGGLGITAGYHRLFAHRSYDASWPLRILLLIMGTGAFEGSVFDWSQDHRAHHRYTDTDKDPYNAKRGFFYSHMGWMLFKRDTPKADISDLHKYALLRFQHRYYGIFAILIGFVLPACIAGFGWNDWFGGIVIAAFAKTVFLHQVTFCINSLAHYWGDATFTERITPRDSYLVSLITFGEGYHNFHHGHPFDWRNGVRSWHYDPGKWLIWTAKQLGMAYNLREVPADLYEKSKLLMQKKKLDKAMAAMWWGPSDESLPTYTWEQIRSENKEAAAAGHSKLLMVVDEYVVDGANFVAEHPGGQKIMEAYVSKDASAAFNGKVYDHSDAARNLLQTLRVGKLAANIAKPVDALDDKIDADALLTTPWDMKDLEGKSFKKTQ